MGTADFLKMCEETVRQYVKEHLDKTDNVPDFEVYCVWNCKTLQNNKALMSTSLFDGMYYEMTYNGDKNELYMDAYKKFENQCFTVCTKDSGFIFEVEDI